MDLDLPTPYTARPYAGPADHPAMVPILTRHREHVGDPEMPTVEQLDTTYANLTNCDPATDIAIVEHPDDGPVGYVRASWEDMDHGGRDCIAFAPLVPEHVAEPLYTALVVGQERHMRPWADGVAPAQYRTYAPHPGPGRPAQGESAWLESLGYTATHFGAALVRPHLDEVPDLPLPRGVEVRPVSDDQLRAIWEAAATAFATEWDSRAQTEEDFRAFVDDPLRDVSLWKVAWAGDTVVGQVRTFVNAEENAARGYRRGYTENISTHADWRNRGIAGALLASSLRELRERGFTEAALGADTDNPGGAFHLYTRLGFELRSYEAVYTRPVG